MSRPNTSAFRASGAEFVTARRLDTRVAATVAALATAAAWPFVAPVSSDAAHYLATAHNFASSGRLSDPIRYVGQPAGAATMHWPPLYPFLVGLAHAAGAPLLVAARFLSLIGMVVASAFALRAALRAYPSRSAAAVVVWVATLPAFLWYGSVAVSEGLAVGLVTVALAAMPRDPARATMGRAVAFGAAAALALATRWSAVALAVPIAYRALVDMRARGAPAQRWWAAAAASAAPVVLALAMWRVGVPDGPRAPATLSLGATLAITVSGAAKAWGAIAVVAAAIALLVPPSAGDDAPADARSVAIDHGLFVAASLAVLLAAERRTAMDAPGVRLLLSATPSVLILAALGAVGLARRLALRPRVPAPAAVAVLALSVIGLHAMTLRRWSHSAMRPGSIAGLERAVGDAEVCADDVTVASFHPTLHWRVLQRAPNTSTVPVRNAVTTRGACAWVLRVGGGTVCSGGLCAMPRAQ